MFATIVCNIIRPTASLSAINQGDSIVYVYSERARTIDIRLLSVCFESQWNNLLMSEEHWRWGFFLFAEIDCSYWQFLQLQLNIQCLEFIRTNAQTSRHQSSLPPPQIGEGYSRVFLHRVEWRHGNLPSQYDLYVVRQHGVNAAWN